MLFINQTELIVLLVACSVAAVCLIAAVVFSLWFIAGRKRNQKRELVDISIDAASAKREFALGEEFVCDGLLINAVYSLEPTREALSAKVITDDEYTRLIEAGEASACYVIKPIVSKAGKYTVNVNYLDKSACYEISVYESASKSIQR